MSNDFRRESAKIYQFPRKTAANAGGHRRDDKLASDVKLQQAPGVEFGSCWYHEAAAQAERARKP